MSPHLNALARRLLAEIVDSFEKLDLVVLLHRGAGPCTIDELAHALAFERDLAGDAIAALAAVGIVRRAGDDRWSLDSEGTWADGVDALVRAYADDRILVHDEMTRLALQRIRGEAAQVFGDAFVVRPAKPRR